MNICSKCKIESNCNSFVEGGETYFFCGTCSLILDSYPSISIEYFLTPEDKLSQIEKNMRDARRRRAEGKSLWNNECKADLHE